MRQKRLQIFEGGIWHYVFRHNQTTGIVTTADYRKALLERDLEHFKNTFGNGCFRAISHSVFLDSCNCHYALDFSPRTGVCDTCKKQRY